jgi:hypothetical protein
MTSHAAVKRCKNLNVVFNFLICFLGFDSRRGVGILLFTTVFRPALVPTQPPIQSVTGALSLRVKRPGREADHSTPSSAEVKECVELYFHSPIRLNSVVLSLKKAQVQLYLYPTFGMLGKQGCKVSIGCIWLRIQTSGELL